MQTIKKVYKRLKGFTVIELMFVVAIIGTLSSFIFMAVGNGRLRAKNAAIVLAMSSLDASIDLEKYPESLEDLCFDFEEGGELDKVRIYIESLGGIWSCDSTEEDYRIFAKLNLDVVLAKKFLTKTVYADSLQHSFGNYYCLNSVGEKAFTHWPGDNLTYPSCNDDDYIADPVDPEPAPEPTPDPDPESDPDPPLEDGGEACGGSKVNVCHFDKTLCVSSKALKAHTKHGDTEGVC